MINKKYQEKLPLLSALNSETQGIIRWCTPSIHPRVPVVRGIYDSDISISYHELGNPSLNTGIFKKAHDLAAKTYKAEHTLFSVNGSTGSNFVVFRALKHQLKQVKMLVQRNVHKSVAVAIEDYEVDAAYLSPNYDNELQIYIPNTKDEILEALKNHPDTNVLLLTNPTYEGLSLNLGDIVKAVRKINKNLIVFVDEAWGAHFPFSERLPVCAMEAGADICVQSTHKQGSGLQQTSMIHWRGNRIESKYVYDSYKSLATTSPSFHLLASLDAARYLMETKGGEIINELLSVSDCLRSGLSTVKGIKVISPDFIMKRYKQVGFCDSSKVLVNVKETGFTGYEIAHLLESQYRIIVEKYEAENILFLTTFQNNKYEAEKTVENLKEVMAKLGKKKKRELGIFPRFPLKIIKKVPSYDVFKGAIIKSSLERSVGKTSAEDIVPYPPGIPLIMKGEEIQRDHIEYLKAIKKTKNLISVVMSDEKFNTIKVVG